MRIGEKNRRKCKLQLFKKKSKVRYNHQRVSILQPKKPIKREGSQKVNQLVRIHSNKETLNSNQQIKTIRMIMMMMETLS